MEETDSNPELETTVDVKPFGGKSRAILPPEFAGETAVVSTITETISDESDSSSNNTDCDAVSNDKHQLTHPVSISDVQGMIQSISGSDIHPHGSMELPVDGRGKYVYSEDIRLRFEISSLREGGDVWISESEYGSVFFDHQPKIEHIEPYVDESLLESVTGDSVDVVWRKDSIQDVIEKLDTYRSKFVYSCDVYWDNNFIQGFECVFREIKQGMILLPLFWGQDTVEECRGTLEYDIALLLSEAPSDAYDMYFDAVGDEFITVGGADRQVVGPGEESSSEEVIQMEEIAERASIIRFDGNNLNK